MLKRIFLLIISCFIFLYSHAQRLEYYVITKNDTLGLLTVSKKTHGSKTVYDYHIEIDYFFVTNISINYKLRSVYEKGKLISSEIHSKVNGNKYNSTETVWNGDHYVVRRANKKVVRIEKDITYSSVLLFFSEPKDIYKVYSELNGVFNEVNKVSKNVYALTVSTNKKNHYEYKNGTLVNAKINSSILSFRLLLKN